MQRAARERTIRFGLSAAAILLTLVAAEIGVRIHESLGSGDDILAASSEGVPLHIVVDAPELYRLNPEHPRISSQGLRNRELPFLKPSGAGRILVLGDSVTYGPGVAAERTFSAQLEALLRETGANADVVNAGVPGYSTYNEFEFYRSRGAAFDPDIVLLVVCMNDVANPRTHWNQYAQIADIPADAIPNPHYDQEVILPRLERARADGAGGSRLLALLRDRFPQLLGEVPRPSEGVPDIRARPQTFITGEDDLGIERLLDEESPEWRWLAGMIGRLRSAVEADGATFALVVMPLAYQLDADYPYFPQAVFARMCERERMLCLDLLAAMRAHTKRDLFLMDRLGSYDIWHLTKPGHSVVARALADFFASRPELRRKLRAGPRSPGNR